MTKLFLTHHKCASGWMADLLFECFAVEQKACVLHTHLSEHFPEQPDDYAYLLLSNASWPFLCDKISKAVHVIRNPLAILVSSYFSHLHSHPTDGWPQLVEQRSKLQQVGLERGMQLTREFIESRDFFPGAVGPLLALAEFDFEDRRVATIRMEDMVVYPTHFFERMFAHFGEELPSSFAALVVKHDFRKKSNGRQPGQTDPKSHYRAGNPMDWTNHLTYAQARDVYESYQPFFDEFYPEVARLFQATPTSAQASRHPQYLKKVFGGVSFGLTKRKAA